MWFEPLGWRLPPVSFEAIGSEVRFEGAVIKAGVERYRYDDGAEV